MSTVEADLYAAVTAAAPGLAGRFYPVNAPPRTAIPYATYTEFAGNAFVVADGDSRTRRAVYQLTVVAATFDSVRSLYRLIDTAVNGLATGTINRGAVIGQNVERDPDTGHYLQIMDLELFYSEV